MTTVPTNADDGAPLAPVVATAAGASAPAEASTSRAPANPAGGGGGGMPSHSAPTILSTPHTLMMSSAPVPSALNHSYAPSQNYGSAWKGKGKDKRKADTDGDVNADGVDEGPGEDQRRMLQQLRGSIAAARHILGRAVRDGSEGRSKLARAMKEVTTHQSALLPTLPSLQAPGGRPPSFSAPPRPMDLLTTMSKRLGIETYLEESQFGLLKTTLAIAGKRFVLDVELEMDSAEGPDNEDATPAPAPTPAPAGAGAGETRGTVRLAKLVVNHVTKDGGTADSASIATAVRTGLEAYLDLWNGSAEQAGGGVRDVDRAEEMIRRLWEDMQDLASLDDLSEQTDRDWFSELQQRAETLAGLCEKQSAYPVATPTVLPRFRLLAGDSAPQLRLRPAGTDEVVTSPFSNTETDTDTGDSSRCAWVVEYVPDNLPGLVVRRNWLLTSDESASTDTTTTVPENSIRLEQLLYSSPSSMTGFPYSADFVHTPSSSSKQAVGGGLQQRWSIVHPGPAGYVVGRIGLTDAADDLERVLTVLRRQALLNTMFTGIFHTGTLATQPVSGVLDDEDEDDTADFDLLSQAPIALPITGTISDNSLRAVMPLPHSTDAKPPTLVLTFTTGSAGELSTEWTIRPHGAEAEMDQLRGKIDAAIHSTLTKGGEDAGADSIVRIVHRIEQALKTNIHEG